MKDITSRSDAISIADKIVKLNQVIRGWINYFKIADMKVSALKKVEDDLYVCTCQYVQYFYGYNADGMLLYGDKTTKRIKCYVKVEQVEDGIEYMIMLGDVKAMSTERL